MHEAECSNFLIRQLGTLGGIILFALSLTNHACLAGDLRKDATRSKLKGIDLDGQLRLFGEHRETQAIVVVFLSTKCPISNGYLPVLNELTGKYRRRGVEVYGVISDPRTTRNEALTHSESYRIAFPVLFDASGALRHALSPTHTPQAFVLNPACEPLYSGAIDDRVIKLGTKKDRASRTFLEDAIKATIEGEQIAVPKTKPIGCYLETLAEAKSEDITYARDIAPIIQANCMSCHRLGQSAPFPLLTYYDVIAHAKQIAEVTHSRFMPPWKPEPNYGRFVDERRLTDHELALIQAWVEAGVPKGNPADLPSMAPPDDEWELGRPDEILQMSQVFKVPAAGPDIRQYFVIPSNLTQHKLVTAVDFKPGAPQTVHHASFYLDTAHAGRRLDAADYGPGYQGFGGPGFPANGTLRSWFPGMTPRHLPRGMGRLVLRDSDIVAEIHYVCTGKIEHDRSRIGVYYAPRSAKQLVQEIQVGNKLIKIPAGEKRHHEQATFTLPVETVLLDVMPHMHVLGSEIKVHAELPDQSTAPLIWIKDWDFNWQSQYSYIEPVRLPQDTRIVVDAWFDNSSDNPLNPNSPPKTVTWGESSTDEMLICHFQCTNDSLYESRVLLKHYEQYFQDSQP